MARVCAFYRMTPTEYWRLTLHELGALLDVMREAGEHG